MTAKVARERTVGAAIDIDAAFVIASVVVVVAGNVGVEVPGSCRRGVSDGPNRTRE